MQKALHAVCRHTNHTTSSATIRKKYKGHYTVRPTSPQRLLSYLLEIKPKRYTFVAYIKEYEKDHTTDTNVPMCADLDGAGWRHRNKG